MAKNNNIYNLSQALAIACRSKNADIDSMYDFSSDISDFEDLYEKAKQTGVDLELLRSYYHELCLFRELGKNDYDEKMKKGFIENDPELEKARNDIISKAEEIDSFMTELDESKPVIEEETLSSTEIDDLINSFSRKRSTDDMLITMDSPKKSSFKDFIKIRPFSHKYVESDKRKFKVVKSDEDKQRFNSSKTMDLKQVLKIAVIVAITVGTVVISVKACSNLTNQKSDDIVSPVSTSQQIEEPKIEFTYTIKAGETTKKAIATSLGVDENEIVVKGDFSNLKPGSKVTVILDDNEVNREIREKYKYENEEAKNCPQYKIVLEYGENIVNKCEDILNGDLSSITHADGSPVKASEIDMIIKYYEEQRQVPFPSNAFARDLTKQNPQNVIGDNSHNNSYRDGIYSYKPEKITQSLVDDGLKISNIKD